MLPRKTSHRKYTRRINSNGEDVYPTVCATQYKMPQQQGDLSGSYVSDYFKLSRGRPKTPLKPKKQI